MCIRDSLRCVDEATGSLLWSKQIKTTGSYWTGCSPALWNDNVIAGGTGVHSYNADDGTLNWHVYTSSSFDHQGMVIVNDTIYFRSTSSSYVSLDASDGSQNWMIGWTIQPLMPTAYGEVNGVGYCVAPYSYSEQCVTAASGSAVWTQSCGGNAYGNVIIIGEYAYFGNTTIYKKHLQTGTNAATYNLGTWQPLGMTTNGEDMVFFLRNTSTYTYKLICLDTNLNFNWETNVGYSNEHPTVVGDYVWITEGASISPQYLTAYSMSDGSKAYTDSTALNTYNPIWGGIVNVNNRLYVTNNNGNLFCFESQ
mgnify:CR=1 FL=1